MTDKPNSPDSDHFEHPNDADSDKKVRFLMRWRNNHILLACLVLVAVGVGVAFTTIGRIGHLVVVVLYLLGFGFIAIEIYGQRKLGRNAPFREKFKVGIWPVLGGAALLIGLFLYQVEKEFGGIEQWWNPHESTNRPVPPQNPNDIRP